MAGDRGLYAIPWRRRLGQRAQSTAGPLYGERLLAVLGAIGDEGRFWLCTASARYHNCRLPGRRSRISIWRCSKTRPPLAGISLEASSLPATYRRHALQVRVPEAGPAAPLLSELATHRPARWRGARCWLLTGGWSDAGPTDSCSGAGAAPTTFLPFFDFADQPLAEIAPPAASQVVEASRLAAAPLQRRARGRRGKVAPISLELRDSPQQPLVQPWDVGG